MVCASLDADEPWQKKFHGVWTKMYRSGRTFRLLKPETFMNESGMSVAQASRFFSIEPEEILVVHDDLELPFGTIRLQEGGGLQGHNGLKSIRQHLASDQFFRLRIGIGRPARGEIASHVLSRFSPEEEMRLPSIVQSATRSLLSFLEDGTLQLPLTETLS
jgi:PTH1 family peptidyl-tRNA hydrolase